MCRWVLKYKTSKNPLIQMTILNLLPRLAAFQPHTFTGGTTLRLTVIQHLIKSMLYTVTCSHSFPPQYPLVLIVFSWYHQPVDLCCKSTDCIAVKSPSVFNHLHCVFPSYVQTSTCQTLWATCWAVWRRKRREQQLSRLLGFL